MTLREKTLINVGEGSFDQSIRKKYLWISNDSESSIIKDWW